MSPQSLRLGLEQVEQGLLHTSAKAVSAAEALSAAAEALSAAAEAVAALTAAAPIIASPPAAAAAPIVASPAAAPLAELAPSACHSRQLLIAHVHCTVLFVVYTVAAC